jgi:copper transport protein
VGAWGALWTTTYGVLVAGKAALLVLVVAAASLSRRWVRRWATAVPSGRPPLGALRASVGYEVAVLSVVLAVTAVLVNTVPGRQAYAPSVTTATTVRGADGQAVRVRVTVDPARLGDQTVSVEVTRDDGTPVALTGASGSLRDPQLGLGPIVFAARPTAPGRAVGTTTVPAPGRWVLDLQLHGSADAYAATTAYTVE